MLRAVAIACLIGLACAAAVAAADAPEGPRLAVLELATDRDDTAIVTVAAGGRHERRVFPGRAGRGRILDGFSRPAWSPDGRQLAFSSRRNGKRAVWIVDADGRFPHMVPGTGGGFMPVFTPDGRGIAFARKRVRADADVRFPPEESTSVWLVEIESGVGKQLTRWRDELEQWPSSFSPDGSTLLLTRLDTASRSGEPEIVALRLDGRTSSLLVGRGAWATYSPDGTKIAFAGWARRRPLGGDIYLVAADGTNRHRLTGTRKATATLPSWDPSGSRLAYSVVRFPRKRGLGWRWSVRQENADGTCPRKILSRPRVRGLAAVWQPGPGREAGPIAC